MIFKIKNTLREKFYVENDNILPLISGRLINSSLGWTTMKTALVLNGEHYGTLTAIRTLSSAGFKVFLAENRWYVPGALSNGLHKRLSHPDPSDEAEYMRWLMDFGKNHPGTFLYPVSDVTCWLYSKHGDQLRQYFDLPYPGPQVIRRILLKPELNRAAAKVGISHPETWSPSNSEEVANIASREPLKEGFVVKPKTQMGQKILHKGFIVLRQSDLVPVFEDFVSRFPSTEIEGLTNKSDCLPMIQRYVASSLKGVFSVAGFISEDGKTFHTQGSVKTLQRPAKMGIGLCFESYSVPAELTEKVRKLCLELGYFGLFEAEFLMTADNDAQIIDFNCRYYSQMGFDIKRGINGLATLARISPTPQERGLSDHRVYRYSLSWFLCVLCLTQTLKLNLAFPSLWLPWLARRDGHYIDKVYSSSDIMPLVGDIIQTVRTWIRNPRSSIKSLFNV
jgi:predicted ATP-grasp superfamily ATP-dependent carboligase